MQDRDHPPAPATASLFDGIGHSQIGRSDLVAHSVATLTPSLTALGSGLLLPRMVGPGFWISTLAGFGLAWLIVMVFDEFASRFSSAGSAYTYVAKGLGATVALVVAVALVAGYAALMAFGFNAATSRAVLSWEAFGGGSPDAPVWATLVLLGAAACYAVIRRGIGFSTRTTMTVEVVTVGLLLVVLGFLVSRHGLPRLEALSLVGASPTRIIAGIALIAMLTVAVESCATLGLEAERPMRAVPGAMRITLLITGGLFLAANLVATTLPHAERSRWRWFDQSSATSPLDALVLFVLAVSMLAMALCAWTALSRLAFAFAREGMLPEVLGRTDGRGVPYVAAWAVGPLGLVVPLATALVPDASSLTRDLLQSATVVMCLTYGFVAVALIPFLRNIDELRPRTVALSTATLGGVALVAAESIRQALEDGSTLCLVLMGGTGALGVLWRVALRTRATHPGSHHIAPIWTSQAGGGTR